MRPLEPNTRTRLSLAELDGVSLAGAPSFASVADAASGESSIVAAGDAVPTSSCPNVLTVEWDMRGVPVSCEVEVVASHLCSIDDIRSYRSDQYQNSMSHDDDVFAARERAESTIERAANRFFQPVMVRCFVDRPNCTTRTQLMSDDGCIVHDIREVASCKLSDGTDVPVRPVRLGSQFVDVSGMRQGEAAVAYVVCGMLRTPPEARNAVRELAAWFLADHMEPDNALSVSNEAGVVNFVVSGVNGETSLPEVNALIKRYERRDLLIG